MTTATTPQTNAATVGAIYEAFGRGDVPAILERFAPDIAWEVVEPVDAAQAAGVPWMQPRHGRDAVPGFFAALGEHMEFNDFQVKRVVAGDDVVIAEIGLDVTMTSSGAQLLTDEIHLWTFNDQGLVSAYRHYADTAKHIAAAGLS